MEIANHPVWRGMFRPHAVAVLVVTGFMVSDGVAVAEASRNPFTFREDLADTQSSAPNDGGDVGDEAYEDRTSLLTQATLLDQHIESVVLAVEQKSQFKGVIDGDTELYWQPNVGCFLRTKVDFLGKGLCAERVKKQIFISQSGNIEFPKSGDESEAERSTPEGEVTPAAPILADRRNRTFADKQCQVAYQGMANISDEESGRIEEFQSSLEAQRKGYARVDENEC